MMKLNEIKIKFLTDCQQHIPALAKLWYEEISRHWALHPSIEKANQKLIEHLNLDKMPMALAALCNDVPIGMACLRENDGIMPGVTPWLGSLVVHPDYRKCKVGQLLIDEIKKQAKQFGHEKLYLLAFDPTIPNWYAKLGWQKMGTDMLFNHPVTVMNIDI